MGHVAYSRVQGIWENVILVFLAQLIVISSNMWLVNPKNKHTTAILRHCVDMQGTSLRTWWLHWSGTQVARGSRCPGDDKVFLPRDHRSLGTSSPESWGWAQVLWDPVPMPAKQGLGLFLPLGWMWATPPYQTDPSPCLQGCVSLSLCEDIKISMILKINQIAR